MNADGLIGFYTNLFIERYSLLTIKFFLRLCVLAREKDNQLLTINNQQINENSPSPTKPHHRRHN